MTNTEKEVMSNLGKSIEVALQQWEEGTIASDELHQQIRADLTMLNCACSLDSEVTLDAIYDKLGY